MICFGFNNTSGCRPFFQLHLSNTGKIIYSLKVFEIGVFLPHERRQFKYLGYGLASGNSTLWRAVVDSEKN